MQKAYNPTEYSSFKIDCNPEYFSRRADRGLVAVALRDSLNSSRTSDDRKFGIEPEK